jgi:hypothetical protein
MGAGITLLRAWASAGSRTTPDNAKIDQGWLVGEQPANDWWNDREYVRDTAINDVINYLNTGVPLSDLTTGTVNLANGELFMYTGGTPGSADEINSSLGPKGISHVRGTNKRGDSIGGSINDSQSLFDISSKTWSLSGDSLSYSSVVELDTGLTWDAIQTTIHAPYAASIVGTSGGSLYTLSVYRMACVEVGGKIRVQTIYVHNPGISPQFWSNLRLNLRYNEYTL